MWILNALMIFCGIAIVLICIWGYGEYKKDPVAFFEPEKAKRPLDVPIYTTEKPGILDKLLEWIE